MVCFMPVLLCEEPFVHSRTRKTEKTQMKSKPSLFFLHLPMITQRCPSQSHVEHAAVVFSSQP